MTEATGFEAKTIHRLLEVDPKRRAFSSGLTYAELGVVKQCIEAPVNPEVAEAKAATAKAMREADVGWRAAIRQINDRGGLGKLPHDGIARAAAAIDAG